MNYWRLWLSVMAVAVASWVQVPGAAQNSTQTAENSAGSSDRTKAKVQVHQDVQAVLIKTVDAKKAKEGDVVEAKTTASAKAAGNVELPKGTKLLGHVRAVKTRAMGSDDSKLGVVFDKAVLKSGQEVPFHGLIISATVPQTPSISADSDMSAGMAGSTGNDHASSGSSPVAGVAGGALGTVGNTVDAAGSTASQTVGNVASSTAGVQANSGANPGVNGVALHGITLDTKASNATNGSVFQSNQQNVKLESGMIIVVQATQSER